MFQKDGSLTDEADAGADASDDQNTDTSTTTCNTVAGRIEQNRTEQSMYAVRVGMPAI